MGINFFDLGKRSDKVEVPPGTVIALQGKPVNAVLLLHSGMAEFLDHPLPQGLSPEELIAGSTRVGLIKGETVCGTSGFFREEPDRWTIRTLSECRISVLPVSSGGPGSSLLNRKDLALQVLRAAQKSIESSLFLLNNYKYLWHKLASITDALALTRNWAAVPGAPKGEATETPDRSNDSLETYSLSLRTLAEKRKITLPEMWDPNIFLDRVQNELEAYGAMDKITVESLIDHPQYLFLKRLLTQGDEILLKLFGEDDPTQYYIFQFLTRSLTAVLNQNGDMALQIRHLSEKIFGNQGWARRLLAEAQADRNPRLAGFLHYLWKFSTRCQADMQKLLNISLTQLYPSLTELSQFHEPESLKSDKEPVKSEGELSHVSGTGLFRDLTGKILAFSELDENFQKEFREALNSLKQLPDKFVAERSAQGVRERFTDLYWQLYGTCFLKVIDSDMKSLIPGIMLHFGLVDETMVTPEQLEQLKSAYARNLSVDSPIPVMTLPYFLEKVFTGEVNPSMNEMGEGFAEKIRQQEKMTPKEKAATQLFENSAEGRVRYEIQQIAHSMAGLLAGSRSRSIPVLSTENLAGNLNHLFVDPQGASEFVDSIRKRDVTIFYREVVLKHKLGNELIPKEVLPNLVLYPVAGNRGIMWQDLDGTRKDSAARIFMPAFFTEKKDVTLLNLLAFLRWELSRSAAGANWMDPTEGGLAGTYYDYIAYYKKNLDLSSEAKEALKDFITRYRTDRERFAEDYKSWVMFEYEHKNRLNPVTRGIFYRYCPFRKPIREQLAKKAVYADHEVRYQNRTRKELLSMDTKMRKFDKANIPVPQELLLWLEVLNG